MIENTILNNLTFCESAIPCVTCLRFDLSSILLLAIFGYYFFAFLGHLFKYAEVKNLWNIRLKLDFTKIYWEYLHLGLVMLYFLINPSNMWVLAIFFVLVILNLVAKKKIN